MTLAARISELSLENPRCGYRRITVLLNREMGPVNHKCVHRLWKQRGLCLPKRRRRRIRRRKPGLLTSQTSRPGECWTYDFMFDWAANGRKLKILTVVDEFTGECLAIRVDTSIRATRVIDVVAGLITEHGTPEHIRSNNGSEFIAYRLQDWLYDYGVETIHVEPGQPWQNGLGESFHGRLRDECLNLEYFRSVREAQVTARSGDGNTTTSGLTIAWARKRQTNTRRPGGRE